MAPADHGEDDGKTVFIPAGQMPGAPDEPAAPPAPAVEPGPAETKADTAVEDAWFSGAPAADAEPAAPSDLAAEPVVGWASAEAESSWGSAEPASDWVSASPPAAESWSAAPAPPPADEGAAATVFAPLIDPAPSGGAFGGAASETPPRPPSPLGGGLPAERTGIALGEVLNGIYEVRRFLARGGMGEVYEGVNVNTDERVAIKVILPHLAADQNVQAMFRKEARTLTRLSDPALVQYRVLAQEPRLGVFYIVTEFIDGQSLADVMGKIHPSAEELRGLIRRLAAGLRTAHNLGAIHRDLSPDNVLLANGELSQAKVIDFGIAKDLDASTGTIVGDGFAGKLGYVAPEQFGDYGREVGPWTDVYSLALVILAVAAGKAPDMGATIVDAIDRRRKGPDLSGAPEAVRPILSQMLEPDPARRLRSMDAVLAALEDPATAFAPAPSTPSGAAPAKGGGKLPAPVLAGAAVAALVVIGGGAFFLMKPGATSKPAEAAAGTGAAAQVDLTKFSQTAEQLISTVPCSWYEVKSLTNSGGTVDVRLTGVSGNPGSAQVFQDKLQQADGGVVKVTEDGVAHLAPAACSALEAVREFRAPPMEVGRWIAPLQPEFSFGPRLECDNDPQKALTVVDLAEGGKGDDLGVIGWESSGKLQAIFTGQGQFDKFRAALADTPAKHVFEKTATGRRLNICADTQGFQGMLVIRGSGQSDLGLPSLTAGQGALPPPDFAQKFAAAAHAKGWRTQMAWYRVAPPGA